MITGQRDLKEVSGEPLGYLREEHSRQKTISVRALGQDWKAYSETLS